MLRRVGVGGDTVGDEPRDRDERGAVRDLEERQALTDARVDESVGGAVAHDLGAEPEARDAVRHETGDVRLDVVGGSGDEEQLALAEERGWVGELRAVRPQDRLVERIPVGRSEQAQSEIGAGQQLAQGGGHGVPFCQLV